MVDIAIAVALGVITLVTAYLGVHVTLHPADSSRQKLGYKLGFIGCGIVAVVLIGIQAYRNNQTQEALQAQISRIYKNTEQPPRVSVTNSIPPAQIILERNPQEKISGLERDKKSRLQALTNQQLRRKSLGVALQMRDFEMNMRRRMGLISPSIVMDNGVLTSDSEEEERLYADSMTVYNNTLLKQAVELRAELWRRLGAVTPDGSLEAFSVQPTETARIADRESIISHGAAYLEKLAGQLPR